MRTLDAPPSLRQRWRHAAIHRMQDHDVRWRSLGALFVAGGVLALVSLLLPTDPGTRDLPIVLVGAVATLTGGTLVAAAGRLPRHPRWLSLVLAFGTVLITLAVIFNRSTASPYAVVYVWVGFDSFFFLERRAAYLHLLWVGFMYAVALVVAPDDGLAHAGRWLMLMGTVAVIGTLADVLRSRSDELIAQLSDAARTDPLTGLLNRRGFEQRLEHELERGRRGYTTASVVVVDLDHFKLVNDRFGHRRGDEVLRAFGKLVTDAKRGVDGAGRLGGEEFALVLPGADIQGAYLFAERLRRRVRDELRAGDDALSASFGVAAFPAHGATAEELLHRADQAMYVAKRLGRNRCVAYSAEVEAAAPADEPSAAPIEHLSAVLLLAETLDLRDTGTAAHSQTVGRYAEMIASGLSLAPERVSRIRLAGVLHDIGKIGVPDTILRKAGPLEPAEWREMQKHAELGARILAGSGLPDISDWVIAHHERPDGTGYPFALGGTDIPLEARILAVADAFEAMTADRVYRPGMARAAAVEELRRCAGTQFDADVVAVFLAALGEPLPLAA